MKAEHDLTQRDVTRWFDANYSRRGFRYLRPYDAYPIYLQLLEAEPTQALLDVGCGPGLLLRAALSKGLHAAGADISATAVATAHEFVPRADVRVANAEALPFDDESFDFVTCIGAIERFFDREKALAEIQRVARPHARFCFMVRNSATLVWQVWRTWLGRRNQQGHQDALDLGQWRALLERNGFAIEAVYMDQWFRQKLRKVFRGFRPHDFRRPERIARPLVPMRFVNEFIFVSRKHPDRCRRS